MLENVFKVGKLVLIMDKKSGGLIAFATGLLVNMVSLVSAQWGYFDTRYISDSVIRFYENFFGPIFAALFGQYYTNEFLFAKILLFFLLILIINVVLRRVPLFEHKGGVSFVISLIVSLFAVRFISENQLINGILLPYGVLGVALATILPFLLFFWFVHHTGMGGAGRRLMWIGYAIVFVVLWFSRSNEILGEMNWIYFGTAIAIAISFVFDRKIRSYFALWEIQKMERRIDDKIVLGLLDDLEQAERHADTEAGKRRAEEIRKQLRERYNVKI